MGKVILIIVALVLSNQLFAQKEKEIFDSITQIADKYYKEASQTLLKLDKLEELKRLSKLEDTVYYLGDSTTEVYIELEKCFETIVFVDYIFYSDRVFHGFENALNGVFVQGKKIKDCGLYYRKNDILILSWDLSYDLLYKYYENDTLYIGHIEKRDVDYRSFGMTIWSNDEIIFRYSVSADNRATFLLRRYSHFIHTEDDIYIFHSNKKGRVRKVKHYKRNADVGRTLVNTLKLKSKTVHTDENIRSLFKL